MKHAEATEVTIQSSKASRGEIDGWQIEIRDNGKGIGKESGSGRGHNNMRERARRLGGALEIETNANGTRVVVWFPA